MNPRDLPARVSAHQARSLLAINSKRIWRKVVAANPQIVHRIPGETRRHYITAEVFKLLPNSAARCATDGEERTVARALPPANNHQSHAH